MDIKALTETINKSLYEWSEVKWSSDNMFWWTEDTNSVITSITQFYKVKNNPRACSYTFYPEKHETKSECLKIIANYKDRKGLPPYSSNMVISYTDLT